MGCRPFGDDDDSSAGSSSNSESFLYKYQWHLKNTGQSVFAQYAGIAGNDINMDKSSGQYTGRGIKVAVVDYGLEIAHEDLRDNIGSGSKNFLNNSSDPTNTSSKGVGHGTSVAGLIAAVANNNVGGRGVAPNATLVGYNYLLNQSDSNEILSLGGADYSKDVAIFNMSYGIIPFMDRKISSVRESHLQYGSTQLRDGKGAIYVKSSGNDFEGIGLPECGSQDDTEEYCQMCEDAKNKGLSCSNANMDPANALPWVITVGATNALGKRASYSTPGSSLWISAPGGERGFAYWVIKQYGGRFPNYFYEPGMVTTDQSGCHVGYSPGKFPLNSFESGHSENRNCNYTSTFAGTSAAAPVVSGAIALMLEANPNLTEREVRHILAKTAKKIDPDGGEVKLYYNGAFEAEQGWITNAAGYNFHNWYGFGQLDVDAAVEMAKNYSEPLPVQVISEWKTESPNLNIPNNTVTGAFDSIPVYQDLKIEAVRIEVDIDHPQTGDLAIELTSPSGTKSILLTPLNSFGEDQDLEGFRMLSNAFYGESSHGEWTLKVVDGRRSFLGRNGKQSYSGTLKKWSIRFYGTGSLQEVEQNAGFDEDFDTVSTHWKNSWGNWTTESGIYKGTVEGRSDSVALQTVEREVASRSTTSSDKSSIEIVDVKTKLKGDFNEDGYFHFIQFDIDVSSDEGVFHEVELFIELRKKGTTQWKLLYGSFKRLTISGPENVTLNKYLNYLYHDQAGIYDFKVRIQNAFYNYEILTERGPEIDPDLSSLPVQTMEYDDKLLNYVGSFWKQYKNHEFDENFLYEVKMKTDSENPVSILLDGSESLTDEHYHTDGLYFRYRWKNNVGEFGIMQLKDSTWSILKEWTASSAINKEWNKLGVQKSDNQYQFYINDQKVWQKDGYLQPKGLVGFGMTAISNDGTISVASAKLSWNNK